MTSSFLIPMASLFCVVVLIVGGMSLFAYNMQERNSEQRKLVAENHEIQLNIWNNLNCNGKYKYLDDKDLTSSTLFNNNQNEQFYREYVLDCLDRPDILGMGN